MTGFVDLPVLVSDGPDRDEFDALEARVKALELRPPTPFQIANQNDPQREQKLLLLERVGLLMGVQIKLL